MVNYSKIWFLDQDADPDQFCTLCCEPNCTFVQNFIIRSATVYRADRYSDKNKSEKSNRSHSFSSKLTSFPVTYRCSEFFQIRQLRLQRLAQIVCYRHIYMHVFQVRFHQRMQKTCENVGLCMRICAEKITEAEKRKGIVRSARYIFVAFCSIGIKITRPSFVFNQFSATYLTP